MSINATLHRCSRLSSAQRGQPRPPPDPDAHTKNPSNGPASEPLPSLFLPQKKKNLPSRFPTKDSSAQRSFNAAKWTPINGFGPAHLQQVFGVPFGASVIISSPLLPFTLCTVYNSYCSALPLLFRQAKTSLLAIILMPSIRVTCRKNVALIYLKLAACVAHGETPLGSEQF